MIKGYRSIGQLVIFALILGLYVALVRRFVVPVTLGLIISLVFRPAYNWLSQKSGNHKHLTAGFSTFVVALCVILPLVLIAIYVVKDAVTIVTNMGELSKESAQASTMMESPIIVRLENTANKIYPVSPEDFRKGIRSVLSEVGTSGSKFLRAFIASVPRKIISVIFFLIAFYFGLVDGPRLAAFLRMNLPFSAAEVTELFNAIRKICNAVVLGALLAGTVQGILIGLAYWIFGIPRPLLFGTLTVLFSFVPLVGCAPTSIGGSIYLLTNGKLGSAAMMMVVFLVASISDNIVKPWVLKGKTELHPLLGLMSVLGGITLFGFSGLFLGPVITVLMIQLVQLGTRRIKESKGRPAVQS